MFEKPGHRLWAPLGLAAVLIASAGCQSGGSHKPSALPPPTTAPLPPTTAALPPINGSVPPTTAAAAPVATPSLVLGKPWAPYQRGYGTTRPTVIDNGGDPTGIVEKITWQSWGGPQAVGTGTASWEPPGQPVAASRPEPATVVAFDPGTCQRAFMYEQVEWYFPGEGQSFAPGNARNICASLNQSSSVVAVSEAAKGVSPGVVGTLSTYFAAIDSGNYQTAYGQLSPTEQATVSEVQFATNESSTDDENIGITSASSTGPHSEKVAVLFTSQQSASKGPQGTTCGTWNLTYGMVLTGGLWLINSSAPTSGSGYAAC